MSLPRQSAPVFNAFNQISEFVVFNMLDKLKATAQGSDGLPYWFLKLIAASISKPLTHIFNLSLGSGIIPSQWKQAIIVPLQKIPNPLSCSDFRPISLTPILSRVLDKIVVRTFLYPIFLSPTHHQLFNDQFAF